MRPGKKKPPPPFAKKKSSPPPPTERGPLEKKACPLCFFPTLSRVRVLGLSCPLWDMRNPPPPPGLEGGGDFYPEKELRLPSGEYDFFSTLGPKTKSPLSLIKPPVAKNLSEI